MNDVNELGNREKLELPLEFSGIRSGYTDERNTEYQNCVKTYLNNFVKPCSKTESRRLLKRFYRKPFCDFWDESVEMYLPAVGEGTMRLSETVYSHDEAILVAKKLIENLSKEELARDFLYGVANNAPEYRTALACYFYIKNLPEHSFLRKYVGMAPTKDGELKEVYSEDFCEICGYKHTLSDEPKMQFWHINNELGAFYNVAHMPRNSLNSAIIYLEEYLKLPKPVCALSDYDHFKKIISVIEESPMDTTAGKLRKILKQSRLTQMTVDEIEYFIDMLGYLDILHTEDSFGLTMKHTCTKDMLDSLSSRGYASHPVNRWTRRCGVDYHSISMLFENIY